MSVRYVNLAALCMTTLLCALCRGQQAPKPTSGYVLPDGTIRIIGAPETEGIVQALNVLFEQSHPGLHLKFERSNTLGTIDSLIFDATLVAPVATPYGGGIAYSDIVKAPPFSIRIAHASVSPTAAVSPLAVIVNPANPMDKISMDQLASIFSKPLAFSCVLPMAAAQRRWSAPASTRSACGSALDRPLRLRRPRIRRRCFLAPLQRRRAR